jgi:alpha-1,3-rhamnosyl/mannosyltransferase
MGCYIPAAWFGSRVIGLEALPLAFVLAELGYVGTLLVALDRRLRFPLPSLLWPVGVSVLATAGLAAVVLAIDALGIDSRWLDTALKLAAGGGMYVALVIWLRHPAASDILAARRPPALDGEGAQRLRVGFDVTYAFGRDGTGRYVASMARELARRDDIELLLFRAPRIERLPRAARLPLNGMLHIIWTQVVMPLWAWQRRIDVLHACATGPLHAPCPVVVTVYDALDFRPDLRPSQVWSIYVRLFGVRPARRSQAVLTGSRASAAEISAYYQVPLDRLHVVPFGSDLPSSPPSRPAAASGLPSEYVLVVASATPRKSVETAVAAVERLRAAGRDTGLVVVGSLPVGSQHTRPWAHELRGVTDGELVWLYQQAAAVVVPSLHEGFGLPVVEALSLGVPVVASDIPALREVGRDGPRFAPPQDVEAFSRELTSIMDDAVAERERVLAGRRFTEMLTWAGTAHATIEVYRVILSSANRGRAWLPTAAS